MKVWFPLTQQEDIMLLHYVQGDVSVLEGHFENESQVEISVSINNAELSQKITVRLLEIITCCEIVIIIYIKYNTHEMTMSSKLYRLWDTEPLMTR